MLPGSPARRTIAFSGSNAGAEPDDDARTIRRGRGCGISTIPGSGTAAALMHRRARARRPTESLEQWLPRFDDHGVHVNTPDELQVASRADELLDRRLLAEKARVALERVPDLYRDAFVLRDLEEMSTSDVAHVLGIEPATVRQRVHRARLILRGFLQELMGGRA